MPTVYSNEVEIPDRDRRLSLFSGDLFAYSPRPSSLAFCEAARGILEEMLGEGPTSAQQRMDERQFALLFETAAKNFQRIVPKMVSAVVADFGCDPETTFFGMPLLAAFTGQGFVAHSLGLPGHPHRDIWYAAAPCQLNWWMPLYDLDASYTFAFHPQYWDSPVQNSSADFDFEEWDDLAQADQGLVVTEPFAQPRPLIPIELTPDIRISCATGGLILSSVAQLYSTVPNETLQTHFSVHFQTVNEADLISGEGASNPDAAAHGSSLSSFVRCSDLRPIPEELVRLELERRSAARLS